MTTLDRLNLNARVKEAWDEGEDGYWVALKRGFADIGFDPGQPTHTIHEWTVKAVPRRMRNVRPCAWVVASFEIVHEN